MRKTYIIPTEKLVNLDATEMLAGSTGVNDGDGLGNNQPKVDDDANQFVKQQSQWDNEW